MLFRSLIILALGAAFAGFIPFSEFVTTDGKAFETEFHLSFSIAPVLLGLAGIFIALRFYKTQNNIPDSIASSLSGIYKSAYRKFYVDEVYLFITQKIIFNFIGRPAAWFDKTVVDGMINLLGTSSEKVSAEIKT